MKLKSLILIVGLIISAPVFADGTNGRGGHGGSGHEIAKPFVSPISEANSGRGGNGIIATPIERGGDGSGPEAAGAEKN